MTATRFHELLHNLADEYELLDAEVRRWRFLARSGGTAAGYPGVLVDKNSQLTSAATIGRTLRFAAAEKKLVEVALPKALKQVGPSRETSRYAAQSQFKILPRWTELYVSSRSEANPTGVEATVSHVSSDILVTHTFPFQRSTSTTLSFATRVLKHVPLTFIHPNSKTRLIWDVLALMVTAYDVFVTTLQTSMAVEPPSSGPEFVLSILVTTFWSADIVMNIFTAYIEQGALVTSNYLIIMHYLRSWFAFDFTVTFVDWVLIVGYGSFEFVRSARVFRAMRLLRTLRLIKTVSITQTVEDLLFGCGQEWQLLVWSVIKILTGILWLGHFVTCAWYFMGMLSKEAGLPTWLEDIEDVKGVANRYAVTLHWITGHLTAAPVDTTIGPKNNFERAFTVFTILCSLLVLGYGLARVTTTLQEFGGRTRARWQLRKYLKASGVPLELTVRIVRFTNDAFERREADSNKPAALTWLNTTLLMELVVSQRSKAMLIHPLWCLLHECYNSGFRRVCNAVHVLMFDVDEKLFNEGDVGETMFITTQGHYKLTDHSMPFADLEFNEQKYFAELALYTHWIHKSSLKAMTFAEAYSMSSQSLLQALRDDPTSAVAVYEYAIQLLKSVQSTRMAYGGDGSNSNKERRRSFVADVRLSDMLPPNLATEAANVMKPKDARHRSMNKRQSDVQVDLIPFVIRALGGDFHDNEILMQLPLVFEELNEANGIYALTSSMDETRRATCSIMSIFWLCRNDYDAFTAEQDPSTKLSRELWDQLQHFVRWAGLSPEVAATLLVFLSIRGVGKVRPVTKLLPKDHCTPEAATYHIIDIKPELIPSMRLLNYDMRELVKSTLVTQSIFNFAQMLQGENNPHAVLELQEAMRDEGNDELLKFYLFAVVGIMCGVSGHESLNGSLFMNTERGTNIVRGLQCLQSLGSSSPQAIYWTCITSQAHGIGLPPCETSEDLAIARLVCLLRATKSDLVPLRETWLALQMTERAMLTSHLLADGIGEVAIMFIYLPLFFANARRNPCVGIYRALLLLVDLLELVHAQQEVSEEPTHEVDMFELASFAKETKCSHTFDLGTERIRLVPVGRTLQVQIMDRGLEHTDRDKLDSLMHSVRRMGRHVFGFGLYPVSQQSFGSQGFCETDWLGTVSHLRCFGRGDCKMRL
mmetsp:Transcript_44220/g.102143  ORF Transcript_44220/g.102143 Transcript_44220/m.102143 type:complete len:1155 (-) Transcript_44220:77-3541(-)